MKVDPITSIFIKGFGSPPVSALGLSADYIIRSGGSALSKNLTKISLPS